MDRTLEPYPRMQRDYGVFYQCSNLWGDGTGQIAPVVLAQVRILWVDTRSCGALESYRIPRG